ncbi:MAG: site-2 protease family protein [Actinomycetota bacterium]
MIPQSIRLGKIMGIEVGVNYSWFIVFGLVTVLLAAFYFPFQYKNLSELTYLFLGVVTSLFFFGSVLLHELTHSLVARTRGIPIKSITLFIFGGVANMTKEPERPRDEFLMAVAGPGMSIALAVVFGVIWLLSETLGLGVLVSAPARYLAFINFILGIFNLVPGFPLDGGRVLRSFLWYVMEDLTKATRIVSWFGQGFAFLLIFIGFYLIFIARGFWLNGIWLIFIGWFLQQAAAASYEQVLLRGTLMGVKVADIMTRDVKTVDGSLNLTELVNDYFMRYKHGRFPVMSDDQLIGTITLHEVRDVPRDQWSEIAVKDVTPALSPKEIIVSGEVAENALAKMAEGNLGHLLVIDDGQLIGIVTKSDVLGVVQVKRGLGV